MAFKDPMAKRRYQDEWVRQNKEKCKASRKLTWERHGHIYYPRKLARNAVADKIRRGKMQRSPTCQQCGVACKTQPHHHNGYDRAHYYDVVWLCSDCHQKVHHG